VFYFSLEYRSLYYKEGCNMVILTKTKCSKPREIPRVMRGNQIPIVCWNLSYQSDRYITPVRPIPKQVRSTGLGWSFYRIPEMFFGYVWPWTRHVSGTIWPLESKLHRTCLALLRTCPDPNSNVSSKRVFISEWPEPILSHPTSLLWQLQRLVFQIRIKDTPPPLSWVAGSWPFA
jgi:hypothetical protein